MSSIARPLSHMPYFERLAELANDSTEWRSVSAALVVLRLFDSWMTAGAEVVVDDAPGLNAVRDQIAHLNYFDEQAVLSNVCHRRQRHSRLPRAQASGDEPQRRNGGRRPAPPPDTRAPRRGSR